MIPLRPGARVRLRAPFGLYAAGDAGTVIHVRRLRICRHCGNPPGLHDADCPPRSSGWLRWKVEYEVHMDSDRDAGHTWRLGCEAGEVEKIKEQTGDSEC